MTDRELLEAAARAAGIPHGEDRLECGLSLTLPDGRHESLPQWNPLTDDGDALRLAVKLGFTVQRGIHTKRVYIGIQDELASEDIGADPYAATRRAIVRAAAAMAPKE